MVGGFNTNVRYRGRVFHVQTEDTGHTSSRVVVTLVYEGGVILSSKKTRYEASIHAAERQKMVRELMEGQHAELVRALKGGELDTELGLRAGGAAAQPTGAGAAGGAAARPAKVAAAPAPAPPAPEPLVERFGEGVISERSLDRVVLAHLGVQ